MKYSGFAAHFRNLEKPLHVVKPLPPFLCRESFMAANFKR